MPSSDIHTETKLLDAAIGSGTINAGREDASGFNAVLVVARGGAAASTITIRFWDAVSGGTAQEATADDLIGIGDQTVSAGTVTNSANSVTDFRIGVIPRKRYVEASFVPGTGTGAVMLIGARATNQPVEDQI